MSRVIKRKPKSGEGPSRIKHCWVTMSTATLSSNSSVFVLEGGQSKQTASPADSLDIEWEREKARARERERGGWGKHSGGAAVCNWRESGVETLRRGRRECEVWQPVLQTTGFYSGLGLWFQTLRNSPFSVWVEMSIFGYYHRKVHEE